MLLLLSGAKWLQQVDKLRVSGRDSRSWGDFVKGLELLPKLCVWCEFLGAVKEGAQFVRKGFHVVLDAADRSLLQEYACLACKQMAPLCVQSAVVFARCQGGITKEQSCAVESANAEKSEPLAHGGRLPSVRGTQLLGRCVSLALLILAL